MTFIKLCFGMGLLSASVLAATAPGKLLWSDEFSGAAGSRPDPSKWTYDLGANGWGNKELENYTDRVENAFLDGEGALGYSRNQGRERPLYFRSNENTGAFLFYLWAGRGTSETPARTRYVAGVLDAWE